ncbi:MAG: hypothetical protein H6817_05530 [Phycisphaerales bacterium]|nr:hypothetical protein [Phycisphaerales bacterium]
MDQDGKNDLLIAALMLHRASIQPSDAIVGQTAAFGLDLDRNGVRTT